MENCVCALGTTWCTNKSSGAHWYTERVLEISHFCECGSLNSELLKVLDLERILEDSQVHGEDVVGPYFPVLEYLTAANCYIPASIKTSDLIDMAAGRWAMEGSEWSAFGSMIAFQGDVMGHVDP